MSYNPPPIPIDPPAAYRISVLGRLNAGWEEWFDGMSIAASMDAHGRTVTILTVALFNRAALVDEFAIPRGLKAPRNRYRINQPPPE